MKLRSTGGDIGFTVCAIGRPLVFPALSGNGDGAQRNTATMTAATEKTVELCGFTRIVIGQNILLLCLRNIILLPVRMLRED